MHDYQPLALLLGRVDVGHCQPVRHVLVNLHRGNREPSPGADVGTREASPGADVGTRQAKSRRVSLVAAQMAQPDQQGRADVGTRALTAIMNRSCDSTAVLGLLAVPTESVGRV